MPTLNFVADMKERPRYHANDASRDVLELEAQNVVITNARELEEAPRLDTRGFQLVEHASGVRDFFSDTERQAYIEELHDVLQAVTGADAVVMTPNALLRFGERSDCYDERDNSRPARFVHIDVSDRTAAKFSQRSAPPDRPSPRRTAHFNLWRVITAPPQDVPLAVCDARTIGAADLVPADAVFDVSDAPEWSFEGLVVRYSPRQAWFYYADMHPAELLVFRTNDTSPAHRYGVAHSAFDAPAREDVPPRMSIEARGICYWYDDADGSTARTTHEEPT